MESKFLQECIENAGHVELNEIQATTLDAIVKNDKIILRSKTGSGKTIAFLLAILSKINLSKNSLQAIIIVPSRELCLQIEGVFRSLQSGVNLSICYGGHSVKTEENSLLNDPQIILGTPGRIVDHIDRGNIDFDSCTFLVIDEFDKCLEFGFNEEMEFISTQIHNLNNVLLASATSMDEIPSYLKMSSPFIVETDKRNDSLDISEILVNYEGNIVKTLSELLISFQHERTIIFCNYREVTEDLSEQLSIKGITSVFYHGGLEQIERERALIKFRNGSSTLLICTDLGSRGLDIPEVKHIVHYQYPNNLEAFIHRQGRTARMGEHGSSYLFMGPETQLPVYIEKPKSVFKGFNKKLEAAIPEWKTIYFSGGKKDKLNKIDIVGFLSKKGELKQNEIGLITVQDRASFVGIKADKISALLKKIKNEKVKGRRIKIDLAR